MELIRTSAYCFEYKTGKLIEFYSHRGDFTKPDFRWADTLELEFKEEEITENHRLQALGRITLVYRSLKSEKPKTLREQDKQYRLLSPLEKSARESGIEAFHFRSKEMGMDKAFEGLVTYLREKRVRV